MMVCGVYKKDGNDEFLPHSQRHTLKLIRKSLLDRTSSRPGALDKKGSPASRQDRRVDLDHRGQRPECGHDLHGHPVEELRIITQLRLGLALASYHSEPHAPCPHGCKHPQTKEPVEVRYGYHLVTDCIIANQGKSRTGRRGDDHPLQLSVLGVTNQEFMYRAAPGHQPGPEEHDLRNDVLTSAKRAEERKHAKYDAICAATGSIFSPSALETTGGHGASTASVYFLSTKQSRDSGLPADVLDGKLKKDHLVCFAGARSPD
jgi:hypothetical protein